MSVLTLARTVAEMIDGEDEVILQAVRLRVERAGGRIEEIVLTRPRPVQVL